ncbi:hypothetical protein FJTKL_05733 [Diaporthe vaccinii]|uniref:Uncharacterized protein n=1 Tax=Diaporthe vaccinii TaxID=105482 RepID=A0ABR4EXP1_9PEZI
MLEAGNSSRVQSCTGTQAPQPTNPTLCWVGATDGLLTTHTIARDSLSLCPSTSLAARVQSSLIHSGTDQLPSLINCIFFILCFEHRSPDWVLSVVHTSFGFPFPRAALRVCCGASRFGSYHNHDHDRPSHQQVCLGDHSPSSSLR